MLPLTPSCPCLRRASYPGRISIVFDATLAAASPIKSPTVTDAVAKMRTFRDSPLREVASPSSSSSGLGPGSPAARKLKLDLEGGLHGQKGVIASKEVAFSSPGQSQMTQRYEPSGLRGAPVGGDFPEGGQMVTLMQVRQGTPPVPHTLMGSGVILDKVEELRGQLSQLHRWGGTGLSVGRGSLQDSAPEDTLLINPQWIDSLCSTGRETRILLTV